MTKPSWKSELLGAALIVLLTVFAYWPALRGGFVWDDDAYVTDNALLTAPDGFRQIWFSAHSQSQYFPLTFTTLRIGHALWGVNPLGYHSLNVLLHAANALLIWLILQRLAIPGAWLAAGIWALHPVQVESVAWITELKNTQSTLFYLLALLAWVGFAQKSEIRNPKSETHWKWYFVALILFLCALFSKTTACTLPAALLLVLWLRHESITVRRLVQVLPFVLLGLVMGLVSIWWERHLGNYEENVGQSLSGPERLLVASRALWFYVGKLVWPVNLTFSYPRWEINVHSPIQYLCVAGCIVSAGLLWWRRAVLGRGVIAGVLFFVATLSPLLGVIPLYTFRYSYVADHYQYVASLGLIAIVAAGLMKGIQNVECRMQNERVCSVLRLIFFILPSAFCISLTLHQAGIYRDLETLWRDTLRKNPASWMAHNNLGAVLMEQGRLDEAEIHYREALRLNPGYGEALGNLGQVSLKRNQVDEAIGYFQRSAHIDPGRGEVFGALGSALLAQGKRDEAVKVLRRGMQYNPNNPSILNNLGAALAETGQLAEALTCYEAALRLKPDNALTRFNLATTLFQLGKTNEAMTQFREVLRREPNQPQFQNQFGRVLAMQGSFAEAESHLREALRLDPQLAEAHANLGWVLAQMGRRDEAIAQLLEAVRLNPNFSEAKQHLRVLGVSVRE